MIPQVVASERGKAQTNAVKAASGLQDYDKLAQMNWNAVGKAITEGENPVQVSKC